MTVSLRNLKLRALHVYTIWFQNVQSQNKHLLNLIEQEYHFQQSIIFNRVSFFDSRFTRPTSVINTRRKLQISENSRGIKYVYPQNSDMALKG